MQGFKNVLAYVKDKGLIKTDIAVSDGTIIKIGENLDIGNAYPYEEGQIIVPAFIDQHIHGANSSDGMDKNVADLKNISDSFFHKNLPCFTWGNFYNANRCIESKTIFCEIRSFLV